MSRNKNNNAATHALIKPTNDVIQDGETNNFNRILKIKVNGIADVGTRFKLEGGYYINEAETILLRSTEITGKFFTKERTIQS